MQMRSAWRAVWLAPLAAIVLLCAAGDARAGHSIETQYALIRYDEETQLNDFLWRITGSRLSPGLTAAEPVKTRVDELTDRVMAMLDIYPQTFRFEILITTEAGVTGPLAHYAHGSDKRIYVSPSTVTDGILAHEIAHAVICAQFAPPPPEKAQEILARYVDENLWSDN